MGNLIFSGIAFATSYLWYTSFGGVDGLQLVLIERVILFVLVILDRLLLVIHYLLLGPF